MSETSHPKDKVFIRGIQSILNSPILVSDLMAVEDAVDLKIAHELATLCANVYEAKDQIEDKWDAKGKRYPILGWQEIVMSELSLPTPKWKYKVKGLQYEVWKKQAADSSILIALVFRGTTIPMDWYTNFRWLTRFIPFTWDHYAQAKSIIPALVDEIHQKVGAENIEIISTGHSLGGGLAHLAAYTSPHIKKVFAFNSSPVTGFYSVSKAEREKNKIGKKAYRIFESGEMLDYFRSPISLVYPLSKSNPQIIEVRYNFIGKNPISQHSIKKLAENLTLTIHAIEKALSPTNSP